MSPRKLAVLAVLALPACVEPDPEVTPEEFLVKKPCGEPYCGNTPMLGDYVAADLDKTQVDFSTGGLRIKRFETSGGEQMTVLVDGFTLHGRKLSDNSDVPPGALIGAKLVVETETPGPTYEIRIHSLVNVPFYKTAGHVLGYRLQYAVIPSGPPPSTPPPLFDVCPPPPGGTHEPLPRESIFFSGDLYDHDEAEVLEIGAAAEPWFNITCHDDARWKLFLMHLATASSGYGPYSSDEFTRTAGLKSIIADYCGNGYSWTQHNTSVDWANDLWLFRDETKPVEAIWDETGAVCLSKPRHTWPACKGKIIPKCTEAQIDDWQSSGTMITFLP